MRNQPIVITPRCQHVYPDGRECLVTGPDDHVHQPPPCANHQPERHHAYLPPTSLTLVVNGKKHRVRLP